MSKYLLLSLIVLGSQVTWAEEPMDDYSFSCKSKTNKEATLHVNGGVDPSGSFAIFVQATGTLRSWNGASFMAKRTPSQNYTSYRSTTPDFPKTVIRIYWGDEEAVAPFKGYIKSAKLNGGKEINLECVVE